MSSQPSVGNATTYVYDGEARRVKKTTNGISTWFVYNAMGELAAEYQATPPSGAAATHFVTTDHLGSTRLVTDASGNVVSRHDYLPFGEEIFAGTGGRTAGMGYVANAGLTPRFTGKERDAETGLDYFGARYLSGVLGRFLSADNGIDQHPEDPQSWNLYTYARNNPIFLVDPTGEYVCGSSLTKEQCDAFQNGLDQAQGAANVAKQKYGADSDEYKKAQRAIDSYGKAGADNGVTIQAGDTGRYAAITTVAGTRGARTTDNPTGQQIEVKFRASELGSAMGQTHEGSHVADGSAWIASGFADALNPTRFQTEMTAYRVSITIGEGLGYRISIISFGSNKYLLAHTAWTQETKDAAIKSILRREYPNFQLKTFQKNTKRGR